MKMTRNDIFAALDALRAENAQLKARVAELEEKEKPEGEEEPACEEPEEAKPEGEGEEAPAEEAPAEESPAEEAPAEEPEEPEDPEDPEKEDPVAAAVREEFAAHDRLVRAVAADPSFAFAAMRGTAVAASSEPAPSAMTREEAEAAYSKLTDAAEKAAFRRAHREILGLR